MLFNVLFPVPEICLPIAPATHCNIPLKNGCVLSFITKSQLF